MGRNGRRGKWRAIAVVCATALTVGVVASSRSLLRRLPWSWSSRGPLDRVATAPVRQADIHPSLNASGVVQSSNRTIIQCQLQNLDVGGHRIGGGASTVLSLVPDGTMVKKGDVLCRLDASDYEEMARQQKILVEAAKAAHRQAQLELEVARLSLYEFREGNLLQDLQQYKSAIALAESDVEREIDRLKWTRKMAEKGYISRAQIAQEEQAHRRALLTLANQRLALKIYEKFTVPKTIRSLENQIATAEATLSYQDARLAQSTERLDTLNSQIERCTITAPHDGMVVYANEPRMGILIQEGMTVRQKQRLFYLPNLAQMEIEALVHETTVDGVHVGMPADIFVEGLPGQTLKGHVTSVAQLPTQNFLSEVRYFVAIVKVDQPPKGLLPGMSAEVRVLDQERPGVLTIPAEALAIEEGKDVCYVAHEGSVERREVKLGRSTRDLLEITEGLEEGEQVVLDPENLDREAVAITPPPAEGPAETESLPVTH
jgi:HlyD family secretion protein